MAEEEEFSRITSASIRMMKETTAVTQNKSRS